MEDKILVQYLKNLSEVQNAIVDYLNNTYKNTKYRFSLKGKLGFKGHLGITIWYDGEYLQIKDAGFGYSERRDGWIQEVRYEIHDSMFVHGPIIMEREFWAYDDNYPPPFSTPYPFGRKIVKGKIVADYFNELPNSKETFWDDLSKGLEEGRKLSSSHLQNPPPDSDIRSENLFLPVFDGEPAGWTHELREVELKLQEELPLYFEIVRQTVPMGFSI